MPKSDTWPGGVGLEAMTSMNSAGSCDSVVSANSGSSDDSLEYLSAEEKACLMFLEETIESLDTEEDSGLSNDEPDQLPASGNHATKLADVSASMSKDKLNSTEKEPSKEPLKKDVDTKVMHSYVVPTPLVVANNSPDLAPSAKLGVPPQKNLSSQPHFCPSSKESSHKHNQITAVPQIPVEVNGLPPPTKPRDYSLRAAEGPLPRGPLSYDALVHLQRSASTKKTPLCPTIDHTIDSDQHLSTVKGPNLGNLPGSDRSHPEAPKSKTAPPVLPPKPKKIPAKIPVKTHYEASITSDSSSSVKHAADPQVVRLEALQKLGLLKDQEPENETEAQLCPPKSHPSFNPTPNRFARGPSNANPSRSPSLNNSQVPPEPRNKPLQTSASFYNHSRSDQQPESVSRKAQSNGLKTTSLEHSANLNTSKNRENRSKPAHIKPVKTTAAAQPGPHKPSNSVGYTVMVVPGMGADRKEALRKLGLLKD